MLAMMFSSYLYLNSRRRLGCACTFTAVAEQCIGEISSFLINFLICFCIFWVIVKLAIISSTIALLLFTTTATGFWSVWNYKITYVILIMMTQLPYLSSTSLTELKCTTYLFFTTIVSMLIILSTKTYIQGAMSLSPSQNTLANVTLETYTDSFNMTVASFGFVLQLYPVYASMQKKERPRFGLAVNLALALCFFVYLALALTSIMFFGADQVQANIFDNFKT